MLIRTRRLRYERRPCEHHLRCRPNEPGRKHRYQENRHTVQNPHTPIIKETMNIAKESEPTDVVFHDKNADRLAAVVRGPRRG